MVRRVVSLVALHLLLALASATSYPLTITDDLGHTVTLPRAPQRVVSMIPSHTETVCALDACSLLVGVDQFSNFPEGVDALPHLGSAYSPNIEALVALEPDLVLADESTGLADALIALGVPVYAGVASTYDEVFTDFARIGLLLDREAEAAALSARLRAAVEQVAALTAGLPSPRVFIELDATPYSAGPDSYIGELVARAGGDNVLDASLGPYPQVDPEAIVAADPEVVVLLDAPFGESPATVAARPGWGQLSAVRQGRVVAPGPDQIDVLSRPGPRLAEAVRLLASWFHPGRF